MGSTLGAERNLLEPEAASCHHVKIDHPVLANGELAKLRHLSDPAFRSATLPMLFDPRAGATGLAEAMDALRAQASAAIEAGTTLLVLSDRGVDAEHAPIPALLAMAGVHHHLVREGTRTRVALLVETGEARECHHMALLLGYGAAAINPYLAFETIGELLASGEIRDVDYDEATRRYIRACTKGVLKVMSKMGISTLQSYRGAQIFEAVGLDKGFVDRYFTWTASRVGGIGIETVADETVRRHAAAFPTRGRDDGELDSGGEYQWRRDGEYHLFNPQTVFKLQHASRSGQREIYREYAELVNGQNRQRATLRGLIALKPADRAVPLDEVEPPEAIFKRFATGAMSYGSISAEAHETLAIAMNRLGGKSNTGEGGEDPARYVPDANGDLRRSAVKQVASGRFGVTSEYLVNSDDIQIKMAQGAKPGEGGQLPGFKVYPWIAKGPLFDARRRPHLAAAAPRHLLHRGPRAAHPRPEEREPRGPHPRQAGGGGRRRHGGRRRGQGALGRRAHLRPRRRHRGLAAHQHQARRRAVGARPGGDPAGAGAERAPRPDRVCRWTGR